MKFSKAAIAIYMGMVFASGGLLGVFGYRYYTLSENRGKQRPGGRRGGPEEFRARLLTAMKTRLNLSPEQVTRWDLLMDETRARVEETKARMNPEMQAIGRDYNEKLKTILTPEQWKEYEVSLKEREGKGKGKRGGRPPGPGF